MKTFLTVLAFILALVTELALKVFSIPPIVAAFAFLLSAFIVLAANRSRIVCAFESFRNGQVKTGVFALLLFIATLGVFAAGNIEDAITSLVMRPSGTRTSDTNGLIRLYSANESNFYAILTNLQHVQFGATGARTGVTATVVVSNVANGVITQSFFNGLLVSTNLGSAGN